MTSTRQPDELISSPEGAVIASADEAARIVLGQSMWAANQGTFAVGGMMVENRTGKVIRVMHNNVLKPLDNGTRLTWDPTAHGERQLVYWYYENRDERGLPDPSEITIVTSLDPCIMCTGALLTAGFNVGVVAIDDYAGVNYDSAFEFRSLPPELRTQAKQTFGYYAAGSSSTPPIYTRPYQGSNLVAFHQTSVSSAHLMACGALFADSSHIVRSISRDDAGKPPKDLKNPAELPEDSPLKVAFRRWYPRAFTLAAHDVRLPGENVIAELRRVASEGSAGNGNAVALLDPFGNLVLCLSGREKVAPVYTPFMEVTQAYARLRWELMNDASTRQLSTDHLTVPKYGTFLFLEAPDPSTAPGIMTIGAYGSTMEGPLPTVFPPNFQYVSSVSPYRLTEALIHLPPLYTDLVQVAASQTPYVQQHTIEQYQVEPQIDLTTTVKPRVPPTIARKKSRPASRFSRHRLTYVRKTRRPDTTE
jgi:cytosine deaminase